MKPTDLDAVWRRQELPRLAVAGIENLEREYASRSARLRLTLFWRDLREILAGLVLIAVYARAAWARSGPAWPLLLAIALVAGVTVFFVAERRKASKRRALPERSLEEVLDADISELEHQRRLLLSVGKWYLAPLTASGALYVGSALVESPASLATKLLAASATTAILASAWWWVSWLNRTAVRKSIEPDLADLRQKRAILLSYPEQTRQTPD